MCGASIKDPVLPTETQRNHLQLCTATLGDVVKHLASGVGAHGSATTQRGRASHFRAWESNRWLVG